MEVEIVLPELGVRAGERITLSAWFADEGDQVYEGDRLVEILVEGSTIDVPSPATGRLLGIRCFVGDVLQVGQLLGTIQVEDATQA